MEQCRHGGEARVPSQRGRSRHQRAWDQTSAELMAAPSPDRQREGDGHQGEFEQKGNSEGNDCQQVGAKKQNGLAENERGEHRSVVGERRERVALDEEAAVVLTPPPRQERTHERAQREPDHCQARNCPFAAIWFSRSTSSWSRLRRST